MTLSLEKCPRCGTRMLKCWDDYICPVHGTIRSDEPAISVLPIQMAVTKGSAMYAGDMPEQQGRVIPTLLRETTRGVAYPVPECCPFCGQAMEKQSQDGHDRKLELRRFKCKLNHKVALFQIDDKVAWR